ncbi:MAG TPA: hypothetical protein VNH44_00160 [Micropepsaceae bacterium]|nr:hypothetical protein [Micropepsaceae bacterium]
MNDQTKYYTVRAAEIRAVAMNISNLKERSRIEMIAEAYDDLARVPRPIALLGRLLPAM